MVIVSHSSLRAQEQCLMQGEEGEIESFARIEGNWEKVRLSERVEQEG